MLEVSGLSAGYGRVQVLWDVDLEVREREVVALVGPNGAGKTTLLRALSGMAQIRDGCAACRWSRSSTSESRTCPRGGACSRG
jgi:branched-chain amino acid transport system ATP-binding protein